MCVRSTYQQFFEYILTSTRDRLFNNHGFEPGRTIALDFRRRHLNRILVVFLSTKVRTRLLKFDVKMRAETMALGCTQYNMIIVYSVRYCIR